jgi:hypothetical protein
MTIPTPNQLRRMLAHVNVEPSREHDEVRSSDLRILKMRLETAIALGRTGARRLRGLHRLACPFTSLR